MTNQEFSDEFDVLYNNIMSNQAPGLDEYEKSVFLTKAQNEILKAYFNAAYNKAGQGFDDNAKRQIDFSRITKIFRAKSEIEVAEPSTKPTIARVTDTVSAVTAFTCKNISKSAINLQFTNPMDKQDQDYAKVEVSYRKSEDLYQITITPCCGEESFGPITYKDVAEFIADNSQASGLLQIFGSQEDVDDDDTYTIDNPTIYPETTIQSEFKDPVYDPHDNSVSVSMPADLMLIINESIKVKRYNKTAILQIIPLAYTEYTRLMSKPYKRPIKNQAWRLINSVDGSGTSDIIISNNDKALEYSLRYIKKPYPIILSPLEGVSIEGYVGSIGGTPVITNATSGIECELDPELHHEILQRAVELAKAAYQGALDTTIAVGNASATEKGVISSNRQ